MIDNRTKKVGVITFHRALNYGAVLQSYALQVFLSQNGFDSELIDYHPASFKAERRLLTFSSPIALVKSLYKYPAYKTKVRRFDRFLNKCHLSAPICDYAKLTTKSADYAFLLVGSDQVWNSQWNHNDMAYYLDFAPLSKKYSYAASLGTSNHDAFSAKRLADHLSSFRRLSVREKSAADLISPLVTNEVSTHVDPTLLLDKTEWLKITHKIVEKPYLLIYTLENDPSLIDKAIAIADERKLEIIQIKDVFRPTKGRIKYASCVAPEHFVSLFSQAAFIVTNSFHGLAFATIFEKDFIVSPQKRQGAPNDRLFDFINKFGLKKQLIDVYDGQIADYQATKKIMASEKEATKAYFAAIKNDLNHEFALSAVSCSGCTACKAVCPTSAITLNDKEDGFYYPLIDDKKCIKCGLCEKVCPYYNKQTISPNNLIKTLAVKNNDVEQRMRSRSGGVFPLLANKVIIDGGTVYGAVINETTFEVHHLRVDNLNDLPQLSESKYAESKLGDTFKHVIKDLKDGREVLFSGTPCQNAGLHHLLKVLKVNDERLVKVDLICHGYFSPVIFKDYVAWERSRQGEIKSFKFRDKAFGWDSHIESFITSKGKVSGHDLADVFYTNAWLRPSCYECPFTNLHRFGDVTLADGWGVKHALPGFDDGKGVSSILLNTEKGVNRFAAIAEQCQSKELAISSVMQINMQRATDRPKQYQRLHVIYHRDGFNAMQIESSKMAGHLSFKNRLKARIVRLLRKLKLR